MDKNNKIYNAQEIETIDSQNPNQSANTLFRFFKHFEYLLEVIEKKALLPRYYDEDVSYLNIPFKKLAYPMICFCDINFHKLKEHVEFYGEYGIAFSKKWGEKEGIQPIQYITPNSNICKDFSESFNNCFNRRDNSKARCYLSTSICYMKPIKGEMPRENKMVKRIFTDECEWRYIQNVKQFELPSVLRDAPEHKLKFCNNVIASKKELWLHFEYSDIKYIIVKTEDDFEKLRKLIINKKLNRQTKDRLISKIRIWDDEGGDY